MAAEMLIKALQVVWQALQLSDTPAAVMGGLAMSVWKYARTTCDVDLLVGVNTHQSDQLLSNLRVFGIRPKRTPPIISLGQLNIIQLLYEPPESFSEVQIDLLLAESAYHLAALERRISTKLPDVPLEISVITCEDLIVHKLLAGRLIDMADVAVLLRSNHIRLDYRYLVHWLKEQNLLAEFISIWKEALPDEPLPIN